MLLNDNVAKTMNSIHVSNSLFFLVDGRVQTSSVPHLKLCLYKNLPLLENAIKSLVMKRKSIIAI
jgi:hypothetical protein